VLKRKTKRRARPQRGAINLPVERFRQPDDMTCGPTCLAQIYRFYGYDKSLEEIIEETPSNPDGGTLAVYLGISALRNGLAAELYSYNLRVFDPTWRELDSVGLAEKLRQRIAAVSDRKLKRAMAGYLEYLKLGGQARFAELDEKLMSRILARGHPILTGCSATYLYGTAREFQDDYDDVRGEPVGHFIVVSGYYPKSGRFVVRDPSAHIPFSRTGTYSVAAGRLISAILLGSVTYDAVLLVIKPHYDGPS
jgi:hypothetical protein